MPENEPSPVDIRCSEACTRTGLTILLLTAFVFSLIPLWREEIVGKELGHYIQLRNNLTYKLDELDADKDWKEFPKEQNPDERELSVLVKYEWGSKKNVDPAPDVAILSSPTAPITPPSAPTALTVTTPSLTPTILGDIIETLKELDDGELTALVHSTSYAPSNSIYKWQLLRIRLLNNKTSKLLEDLTITEVRQLAAYERLSVDSRKLQEGGKRIPLSLTIPEVGIEQATLLVEAALIGALFYFWLFQSEAEYSPSFPASATLFGAVSRTRTSHAVFLILIFIPFIAAALIAWQSFSDSKINIITAVLMLIPSYLILHRARHPIPKKSKCSTIIISSE